jgi:Stage II sporulation protein E (SpoIIE)
MNKNVPLLSLLLVVGACGLLGAQGSNAPAQPELVDRPHAQDWTSEINAGWREHEGDDPAWARPDFDDSAWPTVELDDLGSAQRGFRWFRIHIRLHEDHPDLALLIEGGEGTYAVYANGVELPGPRIRSTFAVKRPTEQTLPITGMQGTDLVLALRTCAPPSYAGWHYPLFMTAVLGTPDAIETQKQAAEGERLILALPSIAINLLLMVAGIGVFALYASQPKHSEYLWLGLYLFLLGTADILWFSQQAGLMPISANFLIADPLLYAVTIAQIYFTFSFGGRRLGVWARIYQMLLLIPLMLIVLAWMGLFSSAIYLLIEAIILLPVAIFMPILLSIWYSHGNKEAGWLILPSLLPAATLSLYDFGSVSIFFGWHWLNFLDNPVQIGPVSLQPVDLGNFLFLLAISVVIFFRFTRVSREQARTAAELGAAREIQQRLVPASLPALAGYKLEAAYMPAQEVGGDFYQVLEQPDGCTLVVVGDVSGKGLKAAMTGALAIGAVRTLAAEDLGPGTLLSRLSYQMRDTQDSGFITCLCVRIGAEGSILAANAGHLSPYRGGEEIPVESGLPLGMLAGIEYSETRIHLQPGDTLTLLSDGVVEAMSPTGQLYGFERTRGISTESARDIAAAAQAFGQEDDITVLTIARLPISSVDSASA